MSFDEVNVLVSSVRRPLVAFDGLTRKYVCWVGDFWSVFHSILILLHSEKPSFNSWRWFRFRIIDNFQRFVICEEHKLFSNELKVESLASPNDGQSFLICL